MWSLNAEGRLVDVAVLRAARKILAGRTGAAKSLHENSSGMAAVVEIWLLPSMTARVDERLIVFTDVTRVQERFDFGRYYRLVLLAGFDQFHLPPCLPATTTSVRSGKTYPGFDRDRPAHACTVIHSRRVAEFRTVSVMTAPRNPSANPGRPSTSSPATAR